MAANIVLAAIVPKPKPPLMRLNIAFATSKASRPIPLSLTTKPINTKSGTTPKK